MPNDRRIFQARRIPPSAAEASVMRAFLFLTNQRARRRAKFAPTIQITGSLELFTNLGSRASPEFPKQTRSRSARKGSCDAFNASVQNRSEERRVGKEGR